MLKISYLPSGVQDAIYAAMPDLGKARVIGSDSKTVSSEPEPEVVAVSTNPAFNNKRTDLAAGLHSNGSA